MTILVINLFIKKLKFEVLGVSNKSGLLIQNGRTK